MKIIDCHHLFGSDLWLSENKSELACKNDYNQLKKQMDSIADDWKTFILPFPSSKNNKYLYENQMIKNAAILDDKILPVFALNTYFDECYNQVGMLLSETAYPNIVLWPILCEIDLIELSKNNKFIKFCEKHNPLVTIHVAAGNESDIGRISELKRYCASDAVYLATQLPHIKFNLSHVLRLSMNALEKAAELTNIVLDTSGISSHNLWYEKGQNVFPSKDSSDFKYCSHEEVITILVKKYELGSKLVFGSSYPFNSWWGFNLKSELDMINRSDLSDEEKLNIMFRNIYDFAFRGKKYE